MKLIFFLLDLCLRYYPDQTWQWIDTVNDANDMISTSEAYDYVCSNYGD